MDLFRFRSFKNADDDWSFAAEKTQDFGCIGGAAHAAKDNAGIIRSGRRENVRVGAVAAQAGDPVGFEVSDDGRIVIDDEYRESSVLQTF